MIQEWGGERVLSIMHYFALNSSNLGIAAHKKKSQNKKMFENDGITINSLTSHLTNSLGC